MIDIDDVTLWVHEQIEELMFKLDQMGLEVSYLITRAPELPLVQKGLHPQVHRHLQQGLAFHLSTSPFHWKVTQRLADKVMSKLKGRLARPQPGQSSSAKAQFLQPKVLTVVSIKNKRGAHTKNIRTFNAQGFVEEFGKEWNALVAQMLQVRDAVSASQGLPEPLGEQYWELPSPSHSTSKLKMR